MEAEVNKKVNILVVFRPGSSLQVAFSKIWNLDGIRFLLVVMFFCSRVAIGLSSSILLLTRVRNWDLCNWLWIQIYTQIQLDRYTHIYK